MENEECALGANFARQFDFIAGQIEPDHPMNDTVVSMFFQ